ncbi:MAG: hypothetical protein ACRD5H_09520 [Nitrososphaerales archaeon]
MQELETRGTELKQVDVRLHPVEQSDQPIMSNFATITVAQGIAYVDFGFIQPALLAKVIVDSQNGKTLPEQVDGKLVARVSLGLDVLGRLQYQMQQVFQNIAQAQVNGVKAESNRTVQG